MLRLAWTVLLAGLSAAPAAADLRCAEATGPTALNPFLARDMPSLRATELIYEGLVTPPDAGEVKPLLAESWKVAPDGRSVTLLLRRGVTWHDGKPFRAQDVAFTVAAGRDARSAGTLRAQFAVFAGASVVDDHTVRVEFARPVVNPMAYFDFRILPAHLYPEGYVGTEAAGRPAVGTGPFAFRRWAPSGELRFEANPTYHRKGEPGIKAIEITGVPDDNIRNELVRYGAVDLVPQVRPRDIPGLEEMSGVRLYPYSTLSYSFFGLNFRTTALRDLRIRQALALALDRGSMLKAHYGNRGTLISGPFPPASWAYNFAVEPRRHDLEAAAKLLDEAGAKLPGKGGVRTYGGAPLVLRLVSLAQNEAQKAVVLDAQQQLKNLGIQVEVRFLEPFAWKTAVFEEHAFDLVLAEWTFDHSVNIYSLFHSTEAGPGRNNLGAYANPQVDRLLEEARGATNSEALRATYGELHRLLHEDVPYLFLWSLHRYAAVASRVENVRLHPFYFYSYVGSWRER